MELKDAMSHILDVGVYRIEVAQWRSLVSEQRLREELFGAMTASHEETHSLQQQIFKKNICKRTSRFLIANMIAKYGSRLPQGNWQNVHQNTQW